MSDDGDRRLTRQGQERKQQLLDHATRLFAERGYERTRVIDIVRAAGVAKGLFYWYFENKEALFRELIERSRHRLRQDQQRAIDPGANALVRIRQGTEASIVFMHGQRRLYSMIDVEFHNHRLSQMFRAGSEIHAADTARHIVEGIELGLIRDEDPLLLAWGVVGAVSSFSHLHRTRRIELALPDMARFAGRYVVHSLAATDEAAREAEEAPASPVVPA